MIVLPSEMQATRETSSPSVVALSVATTITSPERKAKSTGIQTHSSKISKRGHSSMEGATIRQEVKRQVLQRPLQGSVLSPMAKLEGTAQMAGVSYQQMIDGAYPNHSIITDASTMTSYSTQSWSPLPVGENVVSSKQSLSRDSYQATALYKHPSMSFADISFLQTAVSITRDSGLCPAPPVFESRASSNAFLLTHPMIASPVPTSFFMNRMGSNFRRQSFPNTTPINSRTFHPTMLSPSSTFSTFSTFDQRKTGNVVGAAPSEIGTSPALSFASQFCDPTAVSGKESIPVAISTTARDETGCKTRWSDNMLTSAGKMNEVSDRNELYSVNYEAVPSSVQRTIPRSIVFPGGANSGAVPVSVQHMTPRGKTLLATSSTAPIIQTNVASREIDLSTPTSVALGRAQTNVAPRGKTFPALTSTALCTHAHVSPRGKKFPTRTPTALHVQAKVTPRGKTLSTLASTALHIQTDMCEDIYDNDSTDTVVVFCTCPKSRCLKLYCVCFQRDTLCDTSYCKCKRCKNNKEECDPDGARTKAMEIIKQKRPTAFEKRVKRTENGCRCKRNRCLKKYCVCFSKGNSCDKRCSCVACHNQPKASTALSIDSPAYISNDYGSARIVSV